MEFTDYFHEEFTAEDEFGHILFLDWDAKEWQRFDNFMIGCLQFFLKNGLVKDIHKTLAIKTFEANTSPQFREWCEGENSLIQVPGTRNFREDLLSSYLEQNPEHKKWMQWPVMRRYLECYCEYAGMVMKEGNTIKRWCELHVKEGTVHPKELKEEPTTEMEIDEEPPF